MVQRVLARPTLDPRPRDEPTPIPEPRDEPRPNCGAVKAEAARLRIATNLSILIKFMRFSSLLFVTEAEAV